MKEITLTINGQTVQEKIDERTLLLELIRDVVGLTGTHNGCMEAKCGCCMVQVNGKVVKSCNVLAFQAAGAEILTIEGLSPQGLRPIENQTTEGLTGVYKPLDALGAMESNLHPLQIAFREHGAVQCGFCTPGILMAMHHYLQDNPNPTQSEVREALSGNLCRCTGYQKIVEAVVDAAGQMRKAKEETIV